MANINLTINPNPINNGQTSTGTATRSNGTIINQTTWYSEDFTSYSSNTSITSAGWSFTTGNTGSAYIHAGVDKVYLTGSKQHNFGRQFNNTNPATFSWGGGIDSYDSYHQLWVNDVMVYNRTSGSSYTASVEVPVNAYIEFRLDTDDDGGSNLENFVLATEAANTGTDEIAVTLSSDDTGVATVPSTVTILENETDADFTITSTGVGSSDITASYGDASDTETLTVTLVEYNETASGGIELGGASLVEKYTNHNIVASGGITAEGSAIEEFINNPETYNEISSGGAYLSGISNAVVITARRNEVKRPKYYPNNPNSGLYGVNWIKNNMKKN